MRLADADRVNVTTFDAAGQGTTSTNFVVGMDEVGRGAWAGPLTLGAVVLPKDRRVNGVRDSKQLTEARREQLFPRVTEWCAAWSVGHVSAEECDELGMSEAQRLAARRALAGLGVEAEVSEFIKDMADAYAWADLVVCRAGALTVSEVAAAGVAAIFVPLPHAVDDHQTRNALTLVDGGAAEFLPQSELTPAALASRLSWLAGRRETLLNMAQAARRVAIIDAAERVADECKRLATG